MEQISDRRELIVIYNPPQYLGDALQYFFNNAHIKIYQGNTPINLLNLFPLLKQGFATERTILGLLETYVAVNQLLINGVIIPDDLFRKSFNSDISAGFYSLISEGVPSSGITMDDAVDSKLIPNPINTFQVIKNSSPAFNPEELTYQDLIMINHFNQHSIDDFEKADEYLNDDEFINNIFIEHQIAIQLDSVLKISEQMDELFGNIIYQGRLSQIPFEDFILRALDLSIEEIILETENYLLINLLNDPWIHLLYAIIIQDRDLVKNLLKTIDPRIKNNEAYRLAISIGDSKIIDMIKTVAVNRNLLVQQVLTNTIEPLHGPSILPRTIFENLPKTF